jgi:hypothetical protein
MFASNPFLPQTQICLKPNSPLLLLLCSSQVTASGYLNWGNVHLCRGHKALDVAALAGQELSKELLDKVRVTTWKQCGFEKRI